MNTITQDYDVENAVLSRYKQGARQVEPALCCASDGYDSRFLEVLPQEILEKDYGCGDPSKHVGAGQTVVDLGCGAGKICYILAQKVGSAGRVIGVDFNDDMLALARQYHRSITTQIGYDNVQFIKGKIQDLALPLGKLQAWLDRHPVKTIDDVSAFEVECDRLRRNEPMIADDSVDAVVSNCVLNLVKPQQKQQLFTEIFRVLKRGGCAVISDIVCDEDPTPVIVNDPDLWSGCIAGAFREDEFSGKFEQAGFYGVEILSRQQQPWQVIDGIEFRSMTVRAFKGKDGPCLEGHHAVVYKGPWKKVTDDDGHTLLRGQRMAVCDKTYNIYTDPNGPYTAKVDPVPPRLAVALDGAEAFNCQGPTVRDPRQTKGQDYRATHVNDTAGCDSDQCC